MSAVPLKPVATIAASCFYADLVCRGPECVWPERDATIAFERWLRLHAPRTGGEPESPLELKARLDLEALGLVGFTAAWAHLWACADHASLESLRSFLARTFDPVIARLRREAPHGPARGEA